jgi:hypothetical protein
MISANVTIKDTDLGLDKFLKNLESLSKKRIEVGIQATEESKLLIIAGANEFGADIPVTPKMRAFFRGAFKINLKKTTTHIKIPARPFIRQTFDKRLEELKEIGFDLGQLVLDDKMMLEGALELWGDKFVSFIRQEVAEGTNFEANAPLTVEQKGGGLSPLQGTSGKLMNALKGVVK